MNISLLEFVQHFCDDEATNWLRLVEFDSAMGGTIE
ncbi:hypothetical protein SAMN05216414_101161 [Nitrosovibrio sp. Nv17]|jgi:hypothetical protein|nr:hypothetical protein SAMN05216414_101161 [Nitrosovibrio sp. Nv17]